MPTKATLKMPTAKPELIAASLRAISKTYKHDRVAPGLVLAILPTGEFYASICRYYGPGREVIWAAKAISWESAVKQVMQKLLDEPETFNTLRKAIS